MTLRRRKEAELADPPTERATAVLGVVVDSNPNPRPRVAVRHDSLYVYEPPCSRDDAYETRAALLHPDTMKAMAASHFRPWGWYDGLTEAVGALSTAPALAARGMSTGVRSLPLPGHDLASERRVSDGESFGHFAIIGISADEDARVKCEDEPQESACAAAYGDEGQGAREREKKTQSERVSCRGAPRHGVPVSTNAANSAREVCVTKYV